MRGPPDHRTARILLQFFCIAVLFALQLFLRCNVFCVAVFFALQFFLRCPGFLGFLCEGLGWFDAGWGRV